MPHFDRKAEIVSIATELVMESGYDSFSYSDLADRLGIRKASIHHHFPKKEDLGISILDAVHSHLSQVFSEMLARPGSASKKLDAAFAYGRDLCESGKLICPVVSFQAEYNVIPGTMQRRLREIEDVEIDFFTQVLDQGRREGDFAFEGSARDEAIFVVSTIKGAVQCGRSHGKEHFAKAITQLKRSMKPAREKVAA